MGTLYEVPNIENYDLVSLSNLFDWSDEKTIKKTTNFLSKLSTGSGVILRQLNNCKNWFSFLKIVFMKNIHLIPFGENMIEACFMIILDSL